MPIGVGAALLSAGLGSAVASTASNIHGSNRAADVNRRSIDAQRQSEAESIRSDREARAEEAKIAKEQLAAVQKQRDDDRAYERERYNAYLESSQPQWQASQRALSSLFDLAGGGQPGAMPMPTAGAPPPAPMGSRTTPSLVDVAMQRQQGRGLTQSRQMPRMAQPAQAGAPSLMDLARMAMTNESSFGGA